MKSNENQEFRVTWAMGIGVAFILAFFLGALAFIHATMTDPCFLQTLLFPGACVKMPLGLENPFVGPRIGKVVFALFLLLAGIEVVRWWRKA